MKKYLVILLLAVIPALAWGQGKIYTRRAKLEDFPGKITKVVLSGNPMLDTTLKEEIASRWRISPYEFCTIGDYEKIKTLTNYYFLRLATDKDYVYMILTKGGKSQDSDPLKESFDVVTFPVATAGTSSGREFLYMPAFVDLVQQFVEEAMVSERVAYSGIKSVLARKTSGKTISLDPAEADRMFAESLPNGLAGLVIPSAEGSSRPSCYKIVISTDTHQLYYFKKDILMEGDVADFNKNDIKKIYGNTKR